LPCGSGTVTEEPAAHAGPVLLFPVMFSHLPQCLSTDHAAAAPAVPGRPSGCSAPAPLGPATPPLRSVYTTAVPLGPTVPPILAGLWCLCARLRHLLGATICWRFSCGWACLVHLL
jgi:hypothetical protein